MHARGFRAPRSCLFATENRDASVFTESSREEALDRLRQKLAELQSRLRSLAAKSTLGGTAKQASTFWETRLPREQPF